MEAAIQKQVEQTWHSKASLVILLLTILGGYYGLTGKFEEDGKSMKTMRFVSVS